MTIAISPLQHIQDAAFLLKFSHVTFIMRHRGTPLASYCSKKKSNTKLLSEHSRNLSSQIIYTLSTLSLVLNQTDALTQVFNLRVSLSGV